MSEENVQEDPDVQETISKTVAAKVEEATAGLIKNRDQLLSEKKELQEKFTNFQKQWEGLDVEKVRDIMDKMGKDEETRLIAEGKLDQVLEKRTQALIKDSNAKIEAANNQRTTLEQTIKQRDAKIKDLMVGTSVQQAAAQLGVVPSAIEDAIWRANKLFSVDDNGVVARDTDGTLMMSKDGKTPLGPAEWLESMRESAPHWFKGSKGAGSSGGEISNEGNEVRFPRSQMRGEGWTANYAKAKQAAQDAGKKFVVTDG